MSALPEQITICGALDLENYSNIGFDYIVSILNPESPEPVALRAFARHERCTLRFHDIIEDSDLLVAPQAHHINELLEFGRSLGGGPDRRLLVHCFAGMCRSTAAALVLIAQSDLASPPENAITRLLEIAPNAWPNARMVQLGDEALSYNGNLVRAVQVLYDNVCQLYPVFGNLMRHGSVL
jgi:predicted protein tyrosine phosphatase